MALMNSAVSGGRAALYLERWVRQALGGNTQTYHQHLVAAPYTAYVLGIASFDEPLIEELVVIGETLQAWTLDLKSLCVKDVE
ncbi:hypothetical protein DXG03_009261 [Asterophora parasitica]|uniref:Uncharacterized protein n=1 Tax=Asterophora parasitica TaxID=117018 RepID=A0A9P7FZZ0_9AGAR|nr:hypothetical protein DXG03_009261 [Asterophora parasitica]